MSWENCIVEIRAAAGEGTKLSDRDIEKMLETIMVRARRLSRTGMPDPDSISAATAAVADEARRAGLIQKRNQLINLRARLGRRQRIESNPNGFAAGIRAEIHGTATPIFNGRFSAEAEGKALSRRYVAGAITELDQAGLLRAARSKPMERLWGRELYELSKGEAGNPGVTKSPEALKIAKILDKYQTQARADINKAGAAIGDYSGYITATSHDPDKIRSAGLAEWKAFIKPRLDPRTFDYLAGVDGGEERFLDNVFY
ncbi:MAG TPA: hypothetical protein VGR70_06995, partial [Stellaceae bacterium]|nr:hypothetical protein [Stellaceae bacterium]